MKKTNIKLLVRNLVLELIIYGIMLVIYFFAVLRFLGQYLTDLYQNQIFFYAILSLVLIVVQGVFLEAITSFLVRKLRLDRMV